MNPLDPKDIESELSYAYLHAVASKAGIGCKMSPRYEDNRGIDVQLTCYEQFPDCYKEEIDLKIQLKATIQEPSQTDTHFAYFFKGAKQYDLLREETQHIHRLLIVLFLPTNSEEWLNVQPEQLVLKNCAYWVSLRGAEISGNTTGQTVYLPKEQLLTPENLLAIFAKLAKNEHLNYLQP
jgi:hypothetical protein